MVNLTRRNSLLLVAAMGSLAVDRRGFAALLQSELAVAPMKALTKEEIAALRTAAGIPAMGAAWSSNGARPFLIADGLRSIDGSACVTIDDLWHIGSNTKSMTSTLVARLAEQGGIRWDTTVGEVLDDLVPNMHEIYKRVNFRHLLSHHAGMTGGIPEGAPATHFGEKAVDARGDRLRLASMSLEISPVGMPGEKFLYSNVGYVTAAAMLETVYGQPWEELITAQVFEPLCMKSAGFGPPGTPGQLDQPLGHVLPKGGARLVPASLGDPAKPADLPVVAAPAGLVHISMADLIAYLNAHLARDEAFLDAASWDMLHTPPFTHDYAMGWLKRPDGALWHNGSNGKWVAEILVDPERRSVACAVCNSGNLERAEPAIGELLRTASLAAAGGGQAD